MSLFCLRLCDIFLPQAAGETADTARPERTSTLGTDWHVQHQSCTNSGHRLKSARHEHAELHRTRLLAAACGAAQRVHAMRSANQFPGLAKDYAVRLALPPACLRGLAVAGQPAARGC